MNITNDKIYKKHDNEKKRKYNDRVINNEQGSFTPLVFSMNGSTSPECAIYRRFLVEKIYLKTEQGMIKHRNMKRERITTLVDL